MTGIQKWFGIIAALGMAAAAVIIILILFDKDEPVTHPLASSWLLFDVPVKDALRPGMMWDGQTADTTCFKLEKVEFDTADTHEFELDNSVTDAVLRTNLLKAIGLESAAQRTRAWRIETYGARQAIGFTPEPRLDRCSNLSAGLPRYPVITRMLGFDTIIFTATKTTGARGILSAEDSTFVLAATGAQISDTASKVTISKQQGVWIGFQAQALLPDTTVKCSFLTPAFECGDSPYQIRVREYLPSDHFVVEVLNASVPHARLFVDSVQRGHPNTLGVRAEREGTFGEWYTYAVDAAEPPVLARVSIARMRYRVARFRSERDRSAWEAVIRSSTP